MIFFEIFKIKVRLIEFLDFFWFYFVVYESVDYRKMWFICWLKLIVKFNFNFLIFVYW